MNKEAIRKSLLASVIGFACTVYFFTPVQANSSDRDDTLRSFTGDFSSRMAPHLLRCNAHSEGPDCVSTRVWAYLLLRLPLHASRLLESHRDALDQIERALFESDIGRLESAENAKRNDFTLKYMYHAGRSNELFSAHLSNLKAAIGSGIVTNLPPIGALDPRFLPATDQHKSMAVIYLSQGRLAEMCSKGEYDRLANQVVLLGKLEAEVPWQLALVISERNTGTDFMMEIFDREENSKSRYISPSEKALTGVADEQKIAVEDFILDALNAK